MPAIGRLCPRHAALPGLATSPAVPWGWHYDRSEWDYASLFVKAQRAAGQPYLLPKPFLQGLRFLAKNDSNGPSAYLPGEQSCPRLRARFPGRW